MGQAVLGQAVLGQLREVLGQTKRTSFTERIAMMVGMKSRDIVEEEQKAEKGKTFGTISTRTTEAN